MQGTHPAPSHQGSDLVSSWAAFLKANKEVIDGYIRSITNQPTLKLNNEDRRQWIANDETLYRMAQRAGVKV